MQVQQPSGVDFPDALDEFAEDESLLSPVALDSTGVAPKGSPSQLRSSGSQHIGRCGCCFGQLRFPCICNLNSHISL